MSAGLIVHDWLEKFGGSERVVSGILDAFPGAPVYTLWNNDHETFLPEVVQESLLSRTPFRNRKAALLPLLPLVWRRAKARQPFDWVIVSTHSFAHHFRACSLPRQRVPKLLYVHSPARYVWVPDLDPRGTSLVARAISLPLRRVDRWRAKEATAVAANSIYISDRISRTWRVASTVIYPPVRVEYIQSVPDWATRLNDAEASALSDLEPGFILGASRLTPYKRLDLVIQAGQLTEMRVVIAGAGPEEANLRALAARLRVSVSFVIAPSDAMLFTLYQRCAVFVFPPVEDFGIMPVEAAAAGASVVVNKVGGASETIHAGVSGILADFADPNDVARAVRAALVLDREKARTHALRFGIDRFKAEIRNWVFSYVPEPAAEGQHG